KNYSITTATSIFEFLKNWEFYNPPTKEEFTEFIQRYLQLGVFDSDFDTNYGLAYQIVRNTPSEFSKDEDDSQDDPIFSIHSLKEFCDSIDSDPISDRTYSRAGQVFLGWMSLKNHSVLKSVVWHELGHIVSSVLKKDYTWDLGRILSKRELNLELSSESFAKYARQKQCLGHMQKQSYHIRLYSEPHISWFKEGLLPELKNIHPQLIPTIALELSGQRSDLIDPAWYKENVGHFSLLDPSEMKRTTEIIKGEMLMQVDTSHSEEDWADLVSSRVSPQSKNHFCFFIKDNDHSFWENKLIIEPKTTKESINMVTPNEHSSTLFRLLHVHINRSQSPLPSPCQKIAQRSLGQWHLRKCESPISDE
ncbi:MAG: hypothetical protein KDD61_14930, partial [Bdellovibrionales bacterium]|nr:hypothetical protein [Bdellovibrionales bacterium]